MKILIARLGIKEKYRREYFICIQIWLTLNLAIPFQKLLKIGILSPIIGIGKDKKNGAKIFAP